jgi:hypothetical protein
MADDEIDLEALEEAIKDMQERTLERLKQSGSRAVDLAIAEYWLFQCVDVWEQRQGSSKLDDELDDKLEIHRGWVVTLVGGHDAAFKKDLIAELAVSLEMDDMDVTQVLMLAKRACPEIDWL